MTVRPPPVRLWHPQAPPPPRGWLDVATAGPDSSPSVWLARLPDAEPFLPTLAADLSPAERARAERYHQPADRARFILGRALVRRLLAAQLGLAPDALEITLGPSGKPRLAPLPGAPHTPRFNLSHSGDLVLAGFHPDRAVGVDVEQIRADFDLADISAQTFAPETHAAWLTLPPAARPAAFYRAWTRHEAALKATGQGLAEPAAPAGASVVCLELSVASGYAAHVAVLTAPSPE